jgi:hypothetical protein
MIKKGIVLALCVAVLLSASIPLIAQQDPQQSEDQKLDAARKKNLEIKRQIREESARRGTESTPARKRSAENTGFYKPTNSGGTERVGHSCQFDKPDCDECW